MTQGIGQQDFTDVVVHQGILGIMSLQHRPYISTVKPAQKPLLCRYGTEKMPYCIHSPVGTQICQHRVIQCEQSILWAEFRVIPL